MNHVSRFKVLYIQLLIALASAIAGELGPMKDFTMEQLHALTWITWALLVANVFVSVGNTVVASLQKAPEAKPAPTPTTP